MEGKRDGVSTPGTVTDDEGENTLIFLLWLKYLIFADSVRMREMTENRRVSGREDETYTYFNGVQVRANSI